MRGLGHGLSGSSGGTSIAVWPCLHHEGDAARRRVLTTATSAGQRFENGIGHVINAARIEHEICITVERSHLIAVQAPGEVHLIGNAQTLRERGKRSGFWAR
jgi:hypothetical protein